MDVPSHIPEAVDFFISYAGSDVDDAEWIAFELEEEGYRVLFQKWDFLPGNNFPLLMQHASQVATHTLLILTPAFLDAEFTQPEWAAAFARDPTGASRAMIPVRTKPCSPEALLSGVLYIDLVPHFETGDDEGARRALLHGVRPGRAKPSNAPPFPSREEH